MADSRLPRTSPPPIDDPEQGSNFGAWTLVWVLYVTKVFTIVFVVWVAHSYEATMLVTVTTWYWLGPLIGLGIVPLTFQIRLRRVRSRRQQLLASEWSVTPLADTTS